MLSLLAKAECCKAGLILLGDVCPGPRYPDASKAGRMESHELVDFSSASFFVVRMERYAFPMARIFYASFHSITDDGVNRPIAVRTPVLQDKT